MECYQERESVADEGKMSTLMTKGCVVCCACRGEKKKLHFPKSSHSQSQHSHYLPQILPGLACNILRHPRRHSFQISSLSICACCFLGDAMQLIPLCSLLERFPFFAVIQCFVQPSFLLLHFLLHAVLFRSSCPHHLLACYLEPPNLCCRKSIQVLSIPSIPSPSVLLLDSLVLLVSTSTLILVSPSHCVHAVHVSLSNMRMRFSLLFAR